MKFDWLRPFREKALFSNSVSRDGLRQESKPSLFIFGSLHPSYDYSVAEEERRPSRWEFGLISEIGFSSGWQKSLSERPARSYDFSNSSFCYDRSLRVTSGELGNSLARIEVKERYVRDDILRSDINYTGFEVGLVFREDSYLLLQDYLRLIEAPDGFERDTRFLAIRIPVLPFPFPLPRGHEKPWETRPDCVGQLGNIKSFSIDSIAITSMKHEPRVSSPSIGPIFDFYEAKLLSTLVLELR